MRRRTNLPFLLSTLFALTSSAAVGCGDSDGGGNTGGGGNDTGGGGNDTGGGGGNDTGGGGSSGLPECAAQTVLVKGCIVGDTLPPGESEEPFDLEVSGVVTAIRAPAEGEICGNTTHSLGFGVPEVLIDLDLADATSITVGVDAPGFSDTSITEGETLGIKYHWEKVPAGFAYGFVRSLEVTRDGQVVAAIGENAPAVFVPTGGEEVCRNSDGICKLHYMNMEVTGAGATTSIPPDQSADVDGLLVTNDAFYKFYSDGNCNFSFSVEYLMSAVAQ
jgi:hypothetical protein